MLIYCVLPYIILYIFYKVSFTHRNYELALHGGTPFEKGVDVDAAVSLKSKHFCASRI